MQLSARALGKAVVGAGELHQSDRMHVGEQLMEGLLGHTGLVCKPFITIIFASRSSNNNVTVAAAEGLLRSLSKTPGPLKIRYDVTVLLQMLMWSCSGNLEVFHQKQL